MRTSSLTLAAYGALVLTGLGSVASVSDAADPPDVADVMAELVADATPKVQAAAVGASTGSLSKVEDVPGLVRQLRLYAEPDRVARIRFSRSSARAVSFTVERLQKKQPLLVGSVYTRKYYPGWGGVDGAWGKVYSMVAPYAVDPDLVSSERITVEAVVSAGANRFRPISRPVELPQKVDFTTNTLSTRPIVAEGTTEGLLFRDAISGYTSPMGRSYERTVRATGRLILRGSAPGVDRKAVYIRTTQRLKKTPGSAKLPAGYGKQQVGTQTEVWGPFGKRGAAVNTAGGDTRLKWDRS